MAQGMIVEYIEQGRVIISLCLHDKGSRLHLLTTGNREVNISPKRALLVSGPETDTESPRELLLEMLKTREELRSRLKEDVDPVELWNLIKDESESFDNKYLANLVFGESITDDHVSGLVRALFEDQIYFKMKNGLFLANSEERVERIIEQKRQEKIKQERISQGSAWLRQVIRGETPHDTPACREYITGLLEGLALDVLDEPELKMGKELLRKVGITDTRESRNLLVKIGVWDEDENLDLHRYRVETSFSRESVSEADRLSSAPADSSGRDDFRDLETFTIDGPLTRDFDDALNLSIEGEEIHVGVHISDVASIIEPESRLDSDAASRGATLYLPCRNIPMLPDSLSQKALSLLEGEDRPCLSLVARFDLNANLLGHSFSQSLIRVKRRITYDEADRELEAHPSLEKLHFIGRVLKRRRMEKDALDLSLPELEVHFEEDSSLRLELVEQESPSRMIVEEFMILYNWLAAEFLRDKDIPAIFRSQADPAERLSPGELGYIFYVFQQLRRLVPLEIGTKPGAHRGLGVDLYTQCTSPIRRYLDIVVQRQILSALRGQAPVYDKKMLDELRMAVEPVVRTLGVIKRNRLRYWVVKYLKQNRGRLQRALVLDEMKSRYRIVLLDFLVVADIRKENGMILRPGEEIMVKVKKAEPRDDILELSYVEVSEGKEAFTLC